MIGISLVKAEPFSSSKLGTLMGFIRQNELQAGLFTDTARSMSRSSVCAGQRKPTGSGLCAEDTPP